MRFPTYKNSNPPVVLCVSDDTAYLNTIRRNLGEAGFSVVSSRSAAEATELTAESEIDAILCDYNLKQMDALSLYEVLKDKNPTSTPPMLVIAEHFSEPLESKCRAAGTTGLLVKSENVEELIGRVTMMLHDEDKRYYVERTSSRRRFKGGTDSLTRVATKEHFNRRLNGESVAAYRDHSYLSLQFIILDDFDKILSQYGPSKADNTLSQVARLIEGELRSRDCVARYAEHTFAVILPDTPLEAATAVGRRLRRRLATSEFGDLDQPIAITVSVGVTCRPPGTQIATNEMISQGHRSASGAQMMGGDKVLADNALTGSPLVLVVGDPTGETGAIANGLEDCNLELRIATSSREARKLLHDVPVAMVVAEQGVPGAEDGIDLLAWIRNQHPNIRRVLVSDFVDPRLMAGAVNKAAIHYYIAVPANISELPKIVDQLLFS